MTVRNRPLSCIKGYRNRDCRRVISISITRRQNIRVVQRKRGYDQKSVTLVNYGIKKQNREKRKTRLSAIIDNTGKENFEDKILKEGENCNIPDLEPQVFICMPILFIKP